MPEDGHMRPKHIVEEYMQDVAFRMVVTLMYRRLMVCIYLFNRHMMFLNLLLSPVS
jgi:hypothetical protein